MIIALDGPAGAGKSTVARYTAKRLGFYYLDTGAMYRAFTFFVLLKGISLQDLDSMRRLLNEFELHISEERVLIGELDVTAEIRSEKVTRQVSYVSSLDFVRKKMVDVQREIGKNRDIVAEGRDIGTVVFSDARLKFYLDASVEERALRRLKDEKNPEKGRDLSRVAEEIRKRDEYDSTRENSPLRRAPDAFYIDSTHLTVQEVSDLIIRRVQDFKRSN
jgi:cytidylate kinase